MRYDNKTSRHVIRNNDQPRCFLVEVEGTDNRRSGLLVVFWGLFLYSVHAVNIHLVVVSKMVIGFSDH